MIASTSPRPRATERLKIARGEVDTCPHRPRWAGPLALGSPLGTPARHVHARPHVRVRRIVLAIRRTVRETGPMSEQLPDARVLASLLGDQPSTSTDAVAERLHIGADVAERCLAALERDGLV